MRSKQTVSTAELSLGTRLLKECAVGAIMRHIIIHARGFTFLAINFRGIEILGVDMLRRHHTIPF